MIVRKNLFGGCLWLAWWGGLALIVGIGTVPTAGAAEVRYGSAEYVPSLWRSEEGLPHPSVSSIAQTPDGFLWLATWNGLVRFDGVRMKVFDHGNTPGLGNSRLVQLHADSEGWLWIVSATGGLSRMKAGEFQLFTVADGLPLSGASGVAVDFAGNTFLIDGAGGIHRIRDGRIIASELGEIAGHSALPSLLLNGAGGYWFEEQGKLVSSHAEPEKKARLESQEEGGAIGARMACVVSAVGGSVWIVTERDVRNIDLGESSRFVSLLPEAMIDPVSLWQDGRGNLWVGTRNHGLFRLDLSGEWERFFFGAGLADDHVRVIYSGREGNIWVGTKGGLHRLKPRIFRMYDNLDDLPESGLPPVQDRDSRPWIGSALAEDHGGNLYAGTEGGGLTWFHDGGSTVFTEQDGLANNHVCALYVDRQNVLWIGTLNGGLSRFQHGRFVSVTEEDGLPSNSIYSLLEDDRGNLWAGSNRGIFHVSREQLNQFAAGERRTVTAYAYNRFDGLNTLECSSALQPAAWKANDGRLWFATAQGIAVVDPARLPSNPLPPPVFIEEVRLDDRILELPGADEKQARRMSIGISPRNHRIEFHYTGVSFVAPERVRFRYRLQGWDQDWVEAGDRRVAAYNGISPGTYRFHVTACNNSGIWNEAGAAVDLVVNPFWWQSGWLSPMGVAGLSGLLMVVSFRRIQRLKRDRALHLEFSRSLLESQDQERKRIASELHDSIGQSLLIIKNRCLLGLASTEDAAALTRQLNGISKVSSLAIEEVRQIVHHLSVHLLDQLGLTDAIRAMIDRVAASTGTRFESQLENVDDLFSSTAATNFYRIVQEAISNLLKHAQACSARIELIRDLHHVRLTVQDEGKGFDAAQVSTRNGGLGLATMAERVRILGGTLNVESAPGEGTRVSMTIPTRAI
jgi:signal transduction histidine kinase/ligand-binding sensor domain-containing protein